MGRKLFRSGHHTIDPKYRTLRKFVLRRRQRIKDDIIVAVMAIAGILGATLLGLGDVGFADIGAWLWSARYLAGLLIIFSIVAVLRRKQGHAGDPDYRKSNKSAVQWDRRMKEEAILYSILGLMLVGMMILSARKVEFEEMLVWMWSARYSIGLLIVVPPLVLIVKGGVPTRRL